MNITGQAKSSYKEPVDLSWPVLILRDAKNKIVGGATTTTGYTDERVGIILPGETRPWSMAVYDIPSAVSVQGLVGDGVTYMHWT